MIIPSASQYIACMPDHAIASSGISRAANRTRQFSDNGPARKKWISITAVVVCAAAAIPGLRIRGFGIDETVRKMIRQATGVSDDDVKAASGKEKITLFDAYTLAVYNTERMAMEGENSVQSREKRLQAYTSFVPRLSLKAVKAFPGLSREYLTSSRSMMSLYARLPLITGLDEVSGIRAAGSDLRINGYSLRHTAGLLLKDVAASYYSLLSIGKSLKNTEEIMELYLRTLTELRRRVAIGRSRQSEILRTNTQIFKLGADIVSLKNDLDHAKTAFRTVTGIEGDFSLEDGGDPPAPDYSPADFEALTAERWDVKAAREYVEYAKAGEMSAWGLHLPSAYLEGSYILFQDTIRTSTSSPSRYRDYTLSLGVELPILGGDVTFAKVREARSVRRQADLALSGTVRSAGEELLDAYHNWESSGKGLDAYRKAYESADENFRTVSAEYKLNLVTILDLLTAINSLQSAREDYELAGLRLKLDRLNLAVAANEFSGDKISALKK